MSGDPFLGAMMNIPLVLDAPINETFSHDLSQREIQDRLRDPTDLLPGVNLFPGPTTGLTLNVPSPFPSASLTARAALFQENDVANVFGAVYRNLKRSGFKDDPDFVLTPEMLIDTPFEIKPEILADVHSQDEFDFLRDWYQEELDNRQILLAAGGKGMAAAMLSGILSPLTLLSFGMGAATGSILRGGAVGMQAGLLGTAVSEGFLQFNQKFRPIEETGFAIAAGTFLMGVVGSAGGALGRKVLRRGIDDIDVIVGNEAQVLVQTNEGIFHLKNKAVDDALHELQETAFARREIISREQVMEIFKKNGTEATPDKVRGHVDLDRRIIIMREWETRSNKILMGFDSTLEVTGKEARTLMTKALDQVLGPGTASTKIIRDIFGPLGRGHSDKALKERFLDELVAGFFENKPATPFPGSAKVEADVRKIFLDLLVRRDASLGYIHKQMAEELSQKAGEIPIRKGGLSDLQTTLREKMTAAIHEIGRVAKEIDAAVQAKKATRKASQESEEQGHLGNAIDEARESGLENPEEFVALHRKVTNATKDGEERIIDPVTGKNLNAIELMDQIESEGGQRLGEEFSHRRGYTLEEVEDFRTLNQILNTKIQGGVPVGQLHSISRSLHLARKSSKSASDDVAAEASEAAEELSPSAKREQEIRTDDMDTLLDEVEETAGIKEELLELTAKAKLTAEDIARESYLLGQFIRRTTKSKLQRLRNLYDEHGLDSSEIDELEASGKPIEADDLDAEDLTNDAVERLRDNERDVEHAKLCL